MTKSKKSQEAKTLAKTHKALCEEIERYNRAYYLSSPIVTDSFYDKRYRDLVIFEKIHRDVLNLSGSPTHRVGTVMTDGCKHLARMYSLPNAYDGQDLTAFYTRVSKILKEDPLVFAVEEKLDGIAIEIIYKDGSLQQVSTRGDGSVREDITFNARLLPSISKNIAAKGTICIHAEAVMPKKYFESIQESFKSSRSAVSGILRSFKKDISAHLLSGIDIICYALQDSPFPTQTESMAYLASLGFLTTQCRLVSGLGEVLNMSLTFQEGMQLFPYQLDGIVYKLNDLSLAHTCGHTSKFPRSSIAFKFTHRVVDTCVTDIDYQLSRQGKLTPVAHIDPIVIDRVEIRKVTLHNLDFMQKKQIGVGSIVSVQRSGDAIPTIVANLLPRPSVLPSLCPSCHSSLHDFVCVNKHCSGKLLQSLAHFVSRKAFNIRGLSNKTLSLLIEKGYIKEYADIFLLSPEKLLVIPSFKEKKCANLLEAIQVARSIDRSSFFYSLGIQHLGWAKSKQLSTICSPEDLTSAALPKSLGSCTIDSLLSFWKENKQSIHNLLKNVVILR